MIIALEGIMGAGKSHFLKVIKENFPMVRIFNEGLDADIYKQVVKDYYEKPIENAYQFQLTMLWRKMADGLDAQDYERNTKGISVIERTISSNFRVFCNIAYEHNYLKEYQYRVYQQAYNKLKKPLRKPDLILYLNCPAEFAYGRIKSRSRSGEDRISFEYLVRIQELYDDWVENYKGELEEVYFKSDMSDEEIKEYSRKQLRR